MTIRSKALRFGVPRTRRPVRVGLLSGAALCASCVTAGVPADPLPQVGSYTFNGSLRGEHLMRNGVEPFLEIVSGTIDFMPAAIHVNSSHGQCTLPRDPAERERSVVRCGGVSLSFAEGRGEITVPAQQIREGRGSCASYEKSGGGATVCTSWNYIITTRTVRLTGPVTIVSSGSE